MDTGEISSLVTIIGGILTAFGAGSVVPDIGPAINGILAIITLVSAIVSFISHRNKTNVMVAAGIGKV